MCLKVPASTHIVPQVTRSTHIAITQTLHCVGHTVEHRSSLASWKTKLLDLQNKAQWQVPKTKEPWRVRERKPPIGPVSHGKNPNQLESSVCPRYLCACAASTISVCSAGALSMISACMFCLSTIIICRCCVRDICVHLLCSDGKGPRLMSCCGSEGRRCQKDFQVFG